MALDSDELKNKLISDVNDASDAFSEERLNYNNEYIAWVNGGKQGDPPRAPAVPDFLKVMSDSISEYLTDNMELSVTWIAQTTTTPPVTDTLTEFTGNVSTVDLELTRSLIQGMTDPTLINTTINTKYKLSVAKIKISATPYTGVAVTPVAVCPTTATIKFGDSSNSGSDAFEKNMKVLADSVVNGLVGPIVPPISLTGTHGTYVSSGTSKITEIS